jgi:Ca2+-binding RTX toxin-like protein
LEKKAFHQRTSLTGVAAGVATLLTLAGSTNVWADKIVGTPQDDFLSGTSGSDKIKGLGGDDIIDGEEGDDSLYGGNGDDVIFGDAGADRFDCGRGTDAIVTFDPDEGDTKSKNCEPLAMITIDIDVSGPHDPGDLGGTETTGLDIIKEFFAGIVVEPSNSYTVRLASESDGTATVGETTYDVEYSEGCSGDISEFETKSCTITATART